MDCFLVFLVLFYVILCLWFVLLDVDILCMKYVVEYYVVYRE